MKNFSIIIIFLFVFSGCATKNENIIPPPPPNSSSDFSGEYTWCQERARTCGRDNVKEKKGKIDTDFKISNNKLYATYSYQQNGVTYTGELSNPKFNSPCSAHKYIFVECPFNYWKIQFSWKEKVGINQWPLQGRLVMRMENDGSEFYGKYKWIGDRYSGFRYKGEWTGKLKDKNSQGVIEYYLSEVAEHTYPIPPIK